MNTTDPLIPATLPELLAILKQLPGNYFLVAGGTDFMVRHGQRLSPEIRLIDLSGLAELKGINLGTDELLIGALETMTRVSQNLMVQQHAAALAVAAGRVGSWQIRSRATLGGNLVNASPAADTPPALAALEAAAVIVSPEGQRQLAAEDVLIGPNKSALNHDEVLVGFRLPVKQGRISAYGKIGSRTEVSIARLNLAVSAVVEPGGAVTGARVYLGTLGLAARRVISAEKSLIDNGLSDDDILAEALMGGVEEAIPGRSTLPYKRSAVRALGQDVMADLRSRLELTRSDHD